MDMLAAMKRVLGDVEDLKADRDDLRARVEALEAGALPELTSSAEVRFASDEAAERLAAAGLNPRMLLAYKPSGRGGYTVADVNKAILEQG